MACTPGPRGPTTEVGAEAVRPADIPPAGPTASAEQPRTRFVQLPYLIVLACTAAGLAIIRLGAQYVQSGTLVIGGVLLIAAVTRLALSDRRAGMLSSRRRSVDVVIFATLGIGMLVAALVVRAAS